MSMTNFFKEVTARFKGDEAGVIAAKNERKAMSNINSQLAALQQKKVDDESAVEDAEEALNTALYPTVLIIDNNSYCRSIKLANDSLQSAKENLQSTIDSIGFFTEVKAKLEAQVD